MGNRSSKIQDSPPSTQTTLYKDLSIRSKSRVKANIVCKLIDGEQCDGFELTPRSEEDITKIKRLLYISKHIDINDLY